MIQEYWSPITKEEGKIKYEFGTCFICEKPCDSQAYAHSNCVQNEANRIKKALRKKERSILK